MLCANNTTIICNNDTIAANFEDSTTQFVPLEFQATTKNVILAVVLTILDVVTIFGNLLVLLSFVIERRLLQPFNLYILNLAVTDFFVAITAMTFYTLDTLLGYWPFGRIMCGVWIYFDFAMTFASVFTLVAISVDRFWCVTWAIHYRTHNNRFRTAMVLVFIWFSVIAIWTPPFIGDRLQHNEDHFCIWEPSDNLEFVIFVAIVGHYIPCLMMVFLVMRRQATIFAANSQARTQTAVSTVKLTVNSAEHSERIGEPSGNSAILNEEGNRDHLRVEEISQGPYRSTETTQTGSHDQFQATSQFGGSAYGNERLPPRKTGRRKRQKERSNSRERRIFITLTYVLSSYLICWFPFYIAFDMYAWAPDLVPAEMYTFFFWVTYVNSTLNPFIYAYTSKEFRDAFIKVFKTLYKCKI
ncbi:ADA2C-like protein [Mya arenaria]|uniref:ADA2C-like protein n=1 Tax=Mya arenaria TaxID=6604 RepID=A0ABY7E6Z6_MYAAR|nr:ADA2C-like protein [Mya arenaria]